VTKGHQEAALKGGLEENWPWCPATARLGTSAKKSKGKQEITTEKEWLPGKGWVSQRLGAWAGTRLANLKKKETETSAKMLDAAICVNRAGTVRPRERLAIQNGGKIAPNRNPPPWADVGGKKTRGGSRSKTNGKQQRLPPPDFAALQEKGINEG